MQGFKAAFVLLIFLTCLSCSKSMPIEPPLLSSFGDCPPDTYGFISQVLLNGRLTIQIPSEFKIISQEKYKLEHPGSQRPTFTLTNADGSVYILVNYSSENVLPEHLENVRNGTERTFKKLYPAAKWHENGFFRIGPRRCFVIEMAIPSAKKEKTKIMLGTSVNGRLLMVSFTATDNVKPEDKWAEKGRCIMSAIKIND